MTMCLVVVGLGEGLMRAEGVDLGERRYEDREVQLLGKKTWTSCLIQMIFSLPIPALSFCLVATSPALLFRRLAREGRAV